MKFRNLINKFQINKIQLKEILNNKDRLSDKSCVFFIITKTKNIEFQNKTSGYEETLKTSSYPYPKEILETVFKKGDNKTLYIAETDNLRKRLDGLLKYARKQLKDNPLLIKRNKGGRALWQIKNWENLILCYFESDNPLKIKNELLEYYLEEFKVYPACAKPHLHKGILEKLDEEEKEAGFNW